MRKVTFLHSAFSKKGLSFPVTIVAIVAFALMAACAPAAPTATPVHTEAPQTTLSVSGSGSITPVLTAIADEFQAANPGYVLEVLPGSDTGDAVRGTIEGVLDFAAMSRLPRDTETEQGIQFVQFGSSSTAIMSHPEVGVTELTSEQLTGLFTGTITNWSEVGGIDASVIIYIRDPEEGNTVDIREAFIGEEPFVDTAQLMNSQTDMQNALSSVEGSLGYGTWATAIARDAAVTSVIIDGIGTDNPSEEIRSIMGIGYLADEQVTVQPLIDWLLSENGQTALQNVGVILLES
ncbi:MAG: substrate-binding domain-containing protein [Burkholderiales bacterium]|nr:substrate-binding domain-containing protein [Anaerolineae bacterium]